MSDSLRQLPVPRAMYACPPPALPQVRLTHGNHKKLVRIARRTSIDTGYGHERYSSHRGMRSPSVERSPSMARSASMNSSAAFHRSDSGSAGLPQVREGRHGLASPLRSRVRPIPTLAKRRGRMSG